MNSLHKILLLSSISISVSIIFGCSANSNTDSSLTQNLQSLKPVKVEAHGGFFACKVYSKDKTATSNTYYYFPASTESQLTNQDYNQIIQSNKEATGIDYFSLDKNKYYDKITVKACEGLPTSLHENKTEIVYIKDNQEFQVTGWMIKKSDNNWTFINPLQQLTN
jgi:hypothetical protein